MLIIFDWDGTLSDSATKIITCMQEAAVRVQLPVLGDEPIRNIIGLGLPEAIRRLYPDIDPAGVAAMQNVYSQVFVGSGQGEPPFFDGAREAVEGLLAQGHTLAVATGKSRKGLDRVLAESGWHRYFHTSRCADETASKPHPLMLQELLQETGVPVQEAVMIGDTEYDMEMAQNAAMERIAVSYGAHNAERLQVFTPALCTHDLRDLLVWTQARAGG